MTALTWKRILVVIANPFASSQLAAAKAAAVARKCRARVILLDAFMIPQPVPVNASDSREQIVRTVIRQREAQLARIAARFRFPKSTECIARWGYPLHEVVLDEVRRSKPDLVIAESHRHGTLGRLILANTDWELIRDCPCPVWFARSRALPPQPRWLVGVDPRHTHAKPSKLDDRLVQAAQGAKRRLGGAVKLVHAWEDSPKPVPSALSIAAKSIAKLASKHRIELKDCVVHQGDTAEVLADEVQRLRAHVLVMGAVSRSLPARLVIGATAERVIDRVDCDVLIVKPAGFKAPAPRVSKRISTKEL